MKCEHCNGNGYQELEGQCTLPASMCCGGCTKKVQCNICEGFGYIVPSYDDEYAHQLDILMERMKIRILLFRGHVKNHFALGNMELSDKYANRVETCEMALNRLEELYYKHITKQRL